MVEKRTEEGELQLNFSFLENEPHLTIDEILVLNNGLHLFNHLMENRTNPEVTLKKMAEFMKIDNEGQRIAQLILDELKRVGGVDNFGNLSSTIIEQGQREAGKIINDYFTKALDANNPNWRIDAENELRELRKINPFHPS